MRRDAAALDLWSGDARGRRSEEPELLVGADDGAVEAGGDGGDRAAGR